MKRVINLTHKLNDFPHTWRWLSQDVKENLIIESQKMLGYYGELPVGALIACLRGDFGCIGDVVKSCNIGQYIWIDGFGAYAEKFIKTLEKLRVPQTPEQKQASEVCLSSTLEESILIFVCDYFRLHSFREAERISVNEFLIAKKDAYNTAVYQKKINEITFKRK